jgi:hypothetical protein
VMRRKMRHHRSDERFTRAHSTRAWRRKNEPSDRKLMLDEDCR